MGKEQNSEYYDTIYAVSKEYNKDHSKSIYRYLWASMEQWLNKNVPVLDIGCGVGQCAAFLYSKGYNYLGIDFSKEAINKAINNVGNKNVEFYQKDIFKVDYTWYSNYQLFISETLEHINNDLGLLEKIKNEMPNTNIVISVPSFNSKGHVRYFKDEKEVRERYEKVINVKECYKFQLWFVLTGTL